VQEKGPKKKPVTEKRITDFISALGARGGSSGNIALRAVLKWDEELYWRVQDRLIREKRIEVGRGMGGSVKLVPEVAVDIPPPPKGKAAQAERTLYAPLAESLKSKWIVRFSLDDAMVEETHSRGSKDTGGTFTRPDITTVGLRTYQYLPRRLEVVTFEVKPADSVDIMAVLEAIAHREAAHRAYVIYATSREAFDQAAEVGRIMELAQKFGIGVLLAETPEAVESWDLVIDAIRHEPDPGRLDRFLHDLPNQNMKDEISKWRV